MDKNSPCQKFVVAVMSRDRVGIVRDVTGVLATFKANIEQISQTVIMNYFTLTFIVSLPQEHTAEELRPILKSAGSDGEFEISIKPYEPMAETEKVVVDADKFILTVTGDDRPCIIHEIVAYLAGKGINVTDLTAYKPDEGSFTLISQLSVPRKMHASQIQLDIAALSKRVGISMTLQHENIFQATNEVSVPKSFFK